MIKALICVRSGVGGECQRVSINGGDKGIDILPFLCDKVTDRLRIDSRLFFRQHWITLSHATLHTFTAVLVSQRLPTREHIASKQQGHGEVGRLLPSLWLFR